MSLAPTPLAPVPAPPLPAAPPPGSDTPSRSAQDLQPSEAPPPLAELLDRPEGAWHLAADRIDLRSIDPEAFGGRKDLRAMRAQQERLPELLRLLAALDEGVPRGDLAPRIQGLLLELSELGWSSTDLGLRLQALRAELIAPPSPLSTSLFYLLADSVTIALDLSFQRPIRPEVVSVPRPAEIKLSLWPIRGRFRLYFESQDYHLFFHRSFETEAAAEIVGRELLAEQRQAGKLFLHRWRPLATPKDSTASLPPLRIASPSWLLGAAGGLRLWHPHGCLESPLPPGSSAEAGLELHRRRLRTWRGLPDAASWHSLPLPGPAGGDRWLAKLLTDLGLDRTLEALEADPLVESHLQLTSRPHTEPLDRLRIARVQALREAILRSAEREEEPTASELAYLHALLMATRTPISSARPFHASDDEPAETEIATEAVGPAARPAPGSSETSPVPSIEEYLPRAAHRHSFEDAVLGLALDPVIDPYLEAWEALPRVLALLLRAPGVEDGPARPSGAAVARLANPEIVLRLLEPLQRDPYREVLAGQRPACFPLPPFEAAS